MPLTFQDLQQYLTPYTPMGVGANAISRGASNLLQAEALREQKRVDDETERYHEAYNEMLARQQAVSVRGQDIQRKNQEDVNANAAKRVLVDTLKAQQDAERDAINGRRTVMLKLVESGIDPQIAMALAANEGILARRPQQQQAQQEQLQPQINLPPEAISAGINPAEITGPIQQLQNANVNVPSIATEGVRPGEGIQQQEQAAPGSAASQFVAPISEASASRQEYPTDFAIGVGGQEFVVSPQKQLQAKVDRIAETFKEAFENAPEKNKEAAYMVLKMAPSLASNPDLSTKDAANMLIDLYSKSLPKEKGKGGGGGGGGGGGFDKKIYFPALTEGKSELKELELYDTVNGVKDAKRSLELIRSTNGTDQWQAIRQMLKALDNRPSNFDVQTAMGYISLFKKWDNWFTQNTGSQLGEDTRKQLEDSMSDTMLRLHRVLKDDIVPKAHARIENAYFPEEKKALQTLLNTAMAGKTFSWYTPGTAGSQPTTQTSITPAQQSVLDKIGNNLAKAKQGK